MYPGPAPTVTLPVILPSPPSEEVNPVSMQSIAGDVRCDKRASQGNSNDTNCNYWYTGHLGGSNTPIIILPEGSSLEPGSTATIPANDGSGKSVEVVLHGGSLNSPGNVVISIINAVGPNIYTIPLPAIMHPTTAPPELPGVTIYMDKTLKLGEAVATISSNGAVITYGSSGVVVQYPGGAVSTVPLVIGKSGMTSAASGGGGETKNCFVDKPHCKWESGGQITF